MILLIIAIGTIESVNVKKEKVPVVLNIEIPIDIYDPTLSDESSGFCMPFHSCSSNTNRTVCVVLTAFAIFIICFRYHCHEYCDIKKDLDNQTLQESRSYLAKKVSTGNEIFLV
jgi:hypothetical protein